jgi:L-fuconolactonase
VREVLAAEIHAGNGRMRGVRFGTSWDASPIGQHVSRNVPQHQLLDARFREGFGQLAKLGLTFDSWQYFPQMPDLLDLARAFPDTTIIMDHVGGMLGVGSYADRQAEIRKQWLDTLTEVARCPNVHVKLGGAGMTSFGFDFHDRDIPPSSEELAAAWRPYIEPCIELFGVGRCMFESNFPPDKRSCGYTELWNAFKHITVGSSAAEKTALYSGTAATVYRLEKP